MLEHVFTALRSRQGEWVSGEGLSRELSISRSAVWKHVSTLRRQGYGIESSPRKGYRLTRAPGLLSPREIRMGLDTRVFGRKEIFISKETDSTNTQALMLASQGAPEGTLVAAESQSRGRGRRGRTWFSPPGKGLYLSIVLRPGIPPARAPALTLIAGLAAVEALRRLYPGLGARIRWPNDVMINNRKAGGILTEIAGDMDEVGSAVTGLGLNVDFREFPPELQNRATSLALETGRSADRASLARCFLEIYESYWGSFIRGSTEPLFERWRKLSLSLGRQVTVETSAGIVSGVALDIGEDGSLLVRDSQGRVHNVFSGDLRFQDGNSC